MTGYNAILLIVVFFVMVLTIAVVFLALVRETLFWYWRTKGVMQPPQDILKKSHETAILLRKSIAELKAEDSAVIRKARGMPDHA